METLDEVLIEGGEMGALMSSFDWSTTLVGATSNWSQSLKTSVSILLASRFPMIIFWGADLIQLYNDAYRPILGATKHPAALGQRAQDCFPEIWDIIGPMLQSVILTGQATWSDNQLLFLDRNGYAEECYFTFSYSPIRTTDGKIEGVFCAVTETTRQVIGERRLLTLSELSSRTAEAKTIEVACEQAILVLATNPADLPFVQLYLLETISNTARLVGSTLGGEVTGLDYQQIPPLEILETDKQALIAQVVNGGQAQLMTEFNNLAIPINNAEVKSALILPITQPGQEQPAGLLIAGISPHLTLTEDYKSFLELVVGQVATAIANVTAYEEAKKRAEALAELDQAKTAFFSNVSHEFRTPLTLMLGPLEDLLINSEGSLSPKQQEELKLIHRNGLRLLKLVNNLLDFSRLEAGRVEARYEPLDLATFTAELASVFRAAIERAGLKLLVDCPPLKEPAYVDREMWEKIVLNLLSNAFKFTFTGEIKVTLSQKNWHLELAISDTGIGIAEEYLPHIFERFQRIQGVQARTYEGSGIGLALVQELVALHGGTVQVSSVLNKGTIFRVIVPLGKAHLPADRIGVSRTGTSTALGAAAYVEEALRWLPEAPRVSSNFERIPPKTVPYSKAVINLLVVDDNADMRDYLCRLLGEYYEVEAVADGTSALASVKKQVPDLILSDVMLPGISGFELLRELRKNQITARVPIILLSARAGEEAIVEGLQVGADDYLIKPFAARELLARIDTNLRLAQLRDELLQQEQKARAEAEVAKERLYRLSTEAPFFTCILRGSDHVFEYANERYLELIGNKAIIGKPVREALAEPAYEPFYQLIDNVYTTGVSFVTMETLVPKMVRRTKGTPEDAYLNFIYQATRDANGAVDGVLVHGVDVTDHVIARQRADFLAEAGALFSVSLEEYETTLATIANLIVPELADWCIVDILEESGEIRRVAVAHADKAKALVAQELKELVPDPQKFHPVTEVLRSGQAVIQPDILAFPAEQMLGHPEYQMIAAKLDMRSRIIVPMIVSGHIFGAISLIYAREGRYYNQADLQFALELARRAALAVANAGLYQESQKALKVQQELDSLKDLFISIVGHELRTPLTSIKGYSQLLERNIQKGWANLGQSVTRRKSDEAQLRTLQNIRRQSTRMEEQIQQLMDFSRLQNTNLELKYNPTVDLVDLIQQVLELQQANIQDSHVLTFQTRERELVGSWDETRLEQVLNNLISNAVKYSTANSEIIISLERTALSNAALSTVGDQAVLIKIEDHGQGISAEHLPYLFDRYYRVRTKENKWVDGLGLGLYISYQIVKQHGGNMWVESELGLGSTFCITLPLTPP